MATSKNTTTGRKKAAPPALRKGTSSVADDPQKIHAEIQSFTTNLTAKKASRSRNAKQLGEWENYCAKLIADKDEQLRLFYVQLGNLNTAIMQGSGFPTDKEANIQKKLAASIAEIETSTNVAQIVKVAKEFILWIKTDNLELAKSITLIFDGFIKSKLTNS